MKENPKYEEAFSIRHEVIGTARQCLYWGYMLLLQLCPTLCDPIDGSQPDVPGILQGRTLEWVAISFSNACK